MHQEFKKKELLKQILKDKVHPMGVDFVFSFIRQYLSYCKFLHIKPTTKNIVEHFPSIVVANSVYLTDLYLIRIGVDTYPKLGFIINEAVKEGIFKYTDEDSVGDFDCTNNMLNDVRNTFASYPSLIDIRLKDISKK